MAGKYSAMVDHIAKDGSIHGYTYSDMFGLAQHYGFVRRDDGTGKSVSKHIFYVHRDYPDLHFVISQGSGEVTPTKVETIAMECLKVRERNAKAREKCFDKMPQWVLDALPAGTAVEQENHSIVFEASGVVDLASEHPPLVRRYALLKEGTSIRINSLDYPGHDEQFTIVDNMRKREQSFSRVMEHLDEDVCKHIEATTQGFNDRLERLEQNRGFTVTFEPCKDRNARIIHLYHPLYHLDYKLEQPGSGGVITRQLLQQLETVTREHDEQFYAQMEFLENMSAQGWDIQQVKTNGHPGSLTFTRAGSKSFSVPTSGQLEMFDMQLVSALAEAALDTTPDPIVAEVHHLAAAPPTELPMVDRVTQNGRPKLQLPQSPTRS